MIASCNVDKVIVFESVVSIISVTFLVVRKMNVIHSIRFRKYVSGSLNGTVAALRSLTSCYDLNGKINWDKINLPEEGEKKRLTSRVKTAPRNMGSWAHIAPFAYCLEIN